MYLRSVRRCGCHATGTAYLVTTALLLVTAAYLMLDDLKVHQASQGFRLAQAPGSQTFARHRPSREFWMVPTVAASGEIPELDDKWGVLVPTETKGSFRCPNCVMEDPDKLLNDLYDVTQTSSHDGIIGQLSGIGKMAALVFLLLENPKGILRTSDYSSIAKSIERFSHDDQPYGVSGLEYFGEGLTRDSSHYAFYSGRNYTTPCQYRIRYKMKPLWTVGVRCKALQDDGLSEKVSLIDAHSPPIFVSNPKLSVDTFSDSFFSHEGFWGLFASLFPDDEIKTSIWSIWSQRMLQEIEGQIAITPLACPDNRRQSSTNFEPDIKTKDVFDFVTTWTCEKQNSFFVCSQLLVSQLHELRYVTKDDVILHKLWLQTLINIGYLEPKRIPKTTNRNDVIPFCVMHTPALITPTVQELKPEKLFPNFAKACQQCSDRADSSENYIDPFNDYKITKPSKTRDIALIVLFYHPSYYIKNMPLLHDLYNKYFPNFIFCGPDYMRFSEVQQKFRKPVGFIEVQNTHGFIAQECVTRAMIMNFDVQGYLQFSDDNLMNTWAIGDLPRDKFWFQREVLITSRNSTYIPDFFLKKVPWAFWNGWNGVYGKKAIQKVWDTFEELDKEDNAIAKGIVDSFRGTLHANLGNWTDIYYQASDVFYVPARLRRNWIFLADIFSVSNVFLEIAIPTLIYGMDKSVDIFKMAGNYLWYKQRPKYRWFYKFEHHFQHPWKMTWMRNKKDCEFMCYGVLGEIVKERTVE